MPAGPSGGVDSNMPPKKALDLRKLVQGGLRAERAPSPPPTKFPPEKGLPALKTLSPQWMLTWSPGSFC